MAGADLDGPQTHRLRRRADVRRRPPDALAVIGPAPRPDLRPGREPDDDHRAVEGRPRRPRHRADGASACERGRAAHRVEVRGRRTRTTATSPPARSGEILRARRRGDGAATGETRGHGRARCATAGCTPATSAASTRRASSPCEDRSKDLIISGGIQHLPARGGGGAPAPPGGAPRCRWWVGRTRSGARRWSPSWCRRAPAPPHRERPRPALPRPHRALQAAEGLPLRGRPAHQQLRQGAQDGSCASSSALEGDG